MNFRDYMKRAGIESINELARRIGYAPRTLDRVVKNPREAKGRIIYAACEACGMSAEETLQIMK